jgi:uncharacterized protein
MEPIVLSKKQARRFILLKQGLLGEYRFEGETGILNFIKQAGCIQYDPIDVCGKNAELVLQSRIKNFKKSMLSHLLYDNRQLLDYFDKNLSIMRVEDWKYFERIREYHRLNGRGHDEVDAVAERLKEIIEANGPICSKDIDFGQRLEWYWSHNTNLSRVALETLYFRGDLIIHHKKGTAKYYALAKDYIPNEILSEKEPFPDEIDHLKWRVLRRISALGLLWNKPSDAWLNIWNLKSAERNRIFDELCKEGKILAIKIEDCKELFYCNSSDLKLIQEVLQNNDYKERIELIAPLDNMMWDRKLIKEIFNFEYKWEIYTPIPERKYGYYVLPILSGECFIGRIEVVHERKNKKLIVKSIWFEDGVKQTKKLQNILESCLNRFAKFHECNSVEYANN